MTTRKDTCSLIAQLWMMILLPLAMGQRAKVQLPEHYTAMKGDIEVAFQLDANSTHLKSFNAMVHIEYLPGDSVLTNSHTTSDSLHLSSLPIPMGVTKGSVMFDCGTITRAGPHRAVLTVGGQIEAVSPLLQVAWPPVSLRVPASIETYATNVEIVVAFTTTICTPLFGGNSKSGGGNGFLHPNNVIQKDLFESFLVLVECSKSLADSGVSCQLPTKKTDPRVWHHVAIRHFLYTKSSFVVQLNCSVWGQEGIFRVFLTTDLSHAAIVERSAPIEVRTNREYRLDSYFSTVLPCSDDNDIRALSVQRPRCAGPSDKVRVYGRGHRVVNGNFLPGDWRYFGEVRIHQDDDKVAVVPCKLFGNSENMSTFCFHYVSRSIIGTTNTTAKLCTPATKKDQEVVEANWGQWSSWSTCQQSPDAPCGKVGTRSRHRFCVKDIRKPSLICQGQPVEYEECSGQWHCSGKPSTVISDIRVVKVDPEKSKVWRPLSTVEASSPCACGCIYIVNGRRSVDITSGGNCPTLPIHWHIKASGHDKQAQVRIESVDFSCANSVLNVRQKHANGLEEMVFQTQSDVTNVTHGLITVSSHDISLSYHAPRRSCRINIKSAAFSMPQNDTTQDTKSGSEEVNQTFFRHLPTMAIIVLALLLVTVASSLCIMCQFEYRRKKYLVWKSVPSSTCSSPTANVKIRDHINTSTEDILLSSPKPRSAAVSQRQKIKSHLKRASRVIEGHLSVRMRPLSNMIRRSLSEAHVIGTSQDLIPLIPRRHINGRIVKTAVRRKSRRYRRGHYKPLNKPHAPASSPLFCKRRSRSLSDITSLLSTTTLAVASVSSAEAHQEKPDTFLLQSGSEASTSVQFHASRRRRFLSKAAKEKLMERRNKRLITTSLSNDSLATLKPTASVSEISQHSYQSNDLELEFDLYDCDLNNVSAVPGSMFAPTIFYNGDITPTGDEDFEMTELFPMLRPDANLNCRKSKAMVDSVTSDLTVSITSEDLTYATLRPDLLEEEDEDDYVETDTLLSKTKPAMPVLNLTHIEDEVSFVDDDDYKMGESNW